MSKLNLTALLLGAALFTGLGAVSLSAGDKCGNAKKAHTEKCGAGKCGDAKKAHTEKCGAGKCGDAKKAPAAKCGAGKCASK